jgi:hypothetical protein
MRPTIADSGLRDGQVNAQLAQPVAAAKYDGDVIAAGKLTAADKEIANGHLTQALATP